MSVLYYSQWGILISLLLTLITAFLVWKFILLKLQVKFNNKWMKMLNVIILALASIIIFFILLDIIAKGGTGCLIDAVTGKCLA